MSTIRCRAEALLATVLALCLVAGGCGLARDGDRSASTRHVPGPVTAALTRALDARAAAVRRGDASAFLRGLGGSAAFRGQQLTWFDNVTQLPLRRVAFTLEPASLVRDGEGYWAVVDVRWQLDGFDRVPVTTPDRYRWAPARGHPHRFLLTSVTDRRWEAQHDVRDQPWDDGPIEVRAGPGVLGIFDAGSVDQAPALIASLESGIASVAAAVPYDWSRSVVVYALSTPTYLDGLQRVPGDDPEALDAVAVPVPAEPGSDDVASTRIVLNPRTLLSAGPGRDRLLRHELTHVAVGTRDDHVPVWLSEGLAEWVSVRPLSPQDRQVPVAAVVAAQAGDRDLPADATFNDDDSDLHYALAWWAVEYLADAYGEDAPWRLLDAMRAPGADPTTVLREEFGMTTQQLARRADELLLSDYGSMAGAR